MTRRRFFAALGLSCAGLALMNTLPQTAEARNGDGTGPDGNGPRSGRDCTGNGPRRPPRDGRGRGQGQGRGQGGGNFRPRNNGAGGYGPRDGSGPGNGPRDGSGPRQVAPR